MRPVLNLFSIFNILACITLFSQCRKAEKELEHPVYFKRFLTLVDTSSRENKIAALGSLDSALNAFPDPGVFDRYAVDSIKTDVYSYVQHDYSTAIRYADSMLMLVENNVNQEAYAVKCARALYYKGHFFAKLRRFDQGILFNSRAKQVEIGKVKNNCSLVDCNTYLAEMLVDQEKYLEAARAFIKSFNAYEFCPGITYHKLMECQKNLVNAGLTYYRNGFTDSASFYYAKAARLIQINESKFPENHISTENAKAVIYSDQGQVYLVKKDFINATRLFKRSILTTQDVDISFTQYTQIRLIDCYLEQGLLADANELLEHVKQSLDAVPNETALLSWYQLTSKYYERRNDHKSAYRFLQFYYRVKDSVDNHKKQFLAIDVNRRMEEIEQKYLLAVLQKRNEETLYYLYVAVTIIVGSILVVLLIWQNLRHIRKVSLKMQHKNNQLQKAYELLEQSHQENTRIMNVLAHDLKNPLIATKNLVNILLNKKHSDPDREIFMTIQSSCSTSLDLINDLVGTRMASQPGSSDLTDILSIVENSIQVLQTLADDKNQLLLLEGKRLYARVNRQQLWRVLSNLIGNAIKYSFTYSKIIIRLAETGGNFLISVTDYGIGIPEQLKDKIFTTSPEKTRLGTNGEHSTGLGLLISKEIIEAHDGQIWFESSPASGTIFYVSLPLWESI